MSYSIDYCSEKDYIQVIINGELTLELFQIIAKDVAKLTKENDCYSIIFDLRDVNLTTNIFDVYDMPKIAQKTGVTQIYKRALVVGEKDGEFKFLETVFLNQGYTVKLFKAVEEGLTWLLKKQS